MAYPPHVYVIPEDDAYRQIADGFVLQESVDSRRIQVMPVTGGWGHVLETFKREYVSLLRSRDRDHAILLIDFDGAFDRRFSHFQEEIPDDLRSRVFVVGARDEAETLKRALKQSLERIGRSLADDCQVGTTTIWDQDQLRHNEEERKRLVEAVRPFLLLP
jgi:hypothetical protein